tara:strand:- start:92 stop:409 length:318 start_codon:yes stop_codon:yes gene_type:complete
MSKKKPYYPNNWKALRDAPSHWFDSIPYEDFMDWKIAGWEMPSSVACMIRETNVKTGKVKEYIYSRESAAKKKAVEIMDKGESEFIVCTPGEIHHMHPVFEDDDE